MPDEMMEFGADAAKVAAEYSELMGCRVVQLEGTLAPAKQGNPLAAAAIKFLHDQAFEWTDADKAQLRHMRFTASILTGMHCRATAGDDAAMYWALHEGKRLLGEATLDPGEPPSIGRLPIHDPDAMRN